MEEALNHSNRISNKQKYAIAIAGFFTYFFIRYLYVLAAPPYLIDDAYITLRYVQNFIIHGALTYNLEDPVYGITTILYPLLLITSHYLVPSISLTSLTLGVNIVLEYLCIGFIVGLLRDLRLSTTLSVALAATVITNVFLLSASQGGMETPLFCLLLLATAYFISRSYLAAACTAGLSILTRPEGIIIIATVALFTLFTKGSLLHKLRKHLTVYLVLGAFVLAFVAFFYIGYGTLYPASVEVKKLIPRPDLLYATRYILSAPALIIPLGSIPLALRLFLVYSISTWGIWTWSRRSISLCFLLLVVLISTVLYAIGNPPMWYWYAAPLVTVLALFFYLSIFELLKVDSSRRKAVFLLILLSMALLQLRWTFFTEGTLIDRYTERTAIYEQLSRRLKEQEDLKSDQSILTHEIGALGYYSNAKIVDAVGLINPRLAPLAINQEAEAKHKYGLATVSLLKATLPDYIVIQANFIPCETREWDSFSSLYQLLFEEPNSAIDSDSGNVQVYRRQRDRKR